MIRIEVVSTQFEERHGTSGKGKPYSIREQGAYAHLLDDSGKPQRYPVACKLSLDADQPPYAVGFYTIDARSLFVGDFQRLTIGRLRLKPEAQSAQRAA